MGPVPAGHLCQCRQIALLTETNALAFDFIAATDFCFGEFISRPGQSQLDPIRAVENVSF